MDRSKYRKNIPPSTSGSKNKPFKNEINKTNVNPLVNWLGLGIALIGFLAYAQTLGYGFTLDDYSVILENKSTQKGIGAISEFFKTSLRYGYIFISDDLYRPLSKSFYALAWSLSPKDAFPGHVLNVLLYALSGFVLIRALNDWTKSIMTAFITTLLFTVLPIHTEVVANIKSIDEILGFLFGILALDYFYKYTITSSNSKLVVGILWLLLALFSKESSVTLLAVIPLVLYFFTPERGAKIWKPTIIAALVVFFYLAIRQSIIGQGGLSSPPAMADNMLMSTSDLLTRKTTAIYLLGRYLWVIIAGFPLSFDNSYPALPLAKIADWRFLISAVTLITLFVIAILRFTKRDSISFALLFFFITVSVSSNLFLTIGTHWGERLMYLPSLGICLAAGILIDRFLKPSDKFEKRYVALGITGALTVLFVSMTIARNPVWENNGTLYSSGLISAPNSARVQYYLGNYYGKEEQWIGLTGEEKSKVIHKAIEYLQTSLKLYAAFPDAWNQIGVCNYKLKNYEEAYKAYIEGLKYNANDPTLHNNIGTIYFETGRYNEAIEAFKKATALKPNYAEAWCNLGSAYGTLKQYNEAIEAFNSCVTGDPSYANGWYFLGLTWRYAGDEQKAQQFIAKAKELNPTLK